MSITTQELHDLVAQHVGDRKLFVVSNREPYLHSYVGNEIGVTSPASGLVTGIEPLLTACGGTWVAHGSGDADAEVVDGRDRVAVPPGRPRYMLRRVWLTKEEEEGSYYGFANQGLWALCHLAFVRPKFDRGQWETYEAVNRKFARVVLEEAGDGPAMVFIQDYHFALLPRFLKEARPDLLVAHFWHIPWPSPEMFALCPWGREVVEGLLRNDVLGFQTDVHADNFLRTAADVLPGSVDYSERAVTHAGHRTAVGAFPIGVDHEAIAAAAASQEVLKESERLREELNLQGQLVGLGVDRLDYTKGIPERLRAVDRFFEQWTEYQGRFTFLQAGPVSRIHIDEYKALNDELYHLVVEINQKYRKGRWEPIRLLKRNFPQRALFSLYSLADVCIISPLADGMNLVAKEFVAARSDGEAVLLLSRFAGAASELTDALIINPHDLDGFAMAIREALEMPGPEKIRRFRLLRRATEAHNVYDWAGGIITELSRVRQLPSLLPADLSFLVAPVMPAGSLAPDEDLAG